VTAAILAYNFFVCFASYLTKASKASGTGAFANAI
jgi:hypothetical protein